MKNFINFYSMPILNNKRTKLFTMPKFSFLSSIIVALSIGIFSASYANDDPVINNNEEIEPQSFYLNITINDSTYQHKAYASYCKTNDREYFQLTNNPAFLLNRLHWPDLHLIEVEEYEVGDFMLFYTSDDGYADTVIGTTYISEEDSTKTPFWFQPVEKMDEEDDKNELNFSLTDDGIAIEGTVLGFFPCGESSSTPGFTINGNFYAEIVKESNYCE